MWLRLALLGSALTLLLHVVVLVASGQNAIVTPISALSRTDLGWLHTLGLIVFGCAHIALAVALSGKDHGRLWPFARALLVASGATLVYVAYYFTVSADVVLAGSGANDPLWVVASLTGIAMGALQPGLARQSNKLGLFTTVCLGIWLWLMPLLLLVDESWLGAYERIVGAIYVFWLAGTAYGLISSEATKNEQATT